MGNREKAMFRFDFASVQARFSVLIRLRIRFQVTVKTGRNEARLISGFSLGLDSVGEKGG